MSVATKKLQFFFTDAQNRCYYVDNGVVKSRSLPKALRKNPNGWKDFTLQFDFNQNYFATLRSCSSVLKFIEDGQMILMDRLLNGAGTEEILYLVILRNNPAKGLNYYELEYRERVDISSLTGDPRTGVAVNTLQYDVFALVQANENTMYSIPCNSSNPLAVPVLFDGTLLQDKLNYSVTNVPIVNNTGHFWFAVPLTFINNEGDSVGAIFDSQNYANFDNPVTYAQDPTTANDFLVFSVPTVVKMSGTFSFKWSALRYNGSGIGVLFFTSLDPRPDPNKVIFQNIGPALGPASPPFVVGQTYTVTFNMSISLAANEKLFLFMEFADPEINSMTITPFSTNVAAVFASQQQPSVNYVMRPIDVLQSLVSQITLGKYTADSNFLRQNNRKCVLSGSSLRNFPDAQIMTCFADFYKSYFAPYQLGVVVRNGVLWMEPVSDLYNSDNEILRLPNVSMPLLTVAKEFIYGSAKVGYVKQTYNQRNGRYEFNCTHNYTFPITTVLNAMDLVSPYRADSFGMEFIRTDYPDLTTTDDKGDTDVFTVMLSDVIGQTEGVVDNTIPATVVTLILAAPVIRTPFSNTLVYSQYPTITGISQPNVTITVYADGLIDGTTVADASGNWSYQIQTALRPLSLIFNGVHTITANAQTDPSNISDFSAAVMLTVNPALTASFLFTSPTSQDALYDNLPKITGTAPQGSVVSILLDGIQIGRVVANSSSLWTFQTTAPIANGNHTLSATCPTIGIVPSITISVDNQLSTPLITTILYNDTIFTNTPLIKGVAMPGATVDIYIDGGGGPIDLTTDIAAPVGSTVADANGRWQFQFTEMTDPSTDLVINYLPDGLHTFGTTALPANVQAAISGYRLMRGTNKGPVMDYDSIRMDDAYVPAGVDPSTLPPTLGQFLHPETLYNIEETSPYLVLRAHDNITSSFLSQQALQSIIFNGAEVNANLTRSKTGVVMSENASVPVNTLAKNLYWPFWFSFKSPVPTTFNDIMTQLQTGGYITAEIKGLELYLLPIGQMTMKPATDEAQTWKLLVSGKTPYTTLLALFQTGTSIQIGKNMIYRSDYNPLHFVKYNATPAAGCHFADIYDDWEENRFPRYKLYNPDYRQPWQIPTDTIVDQIVTNGVGECELHLVSVATGLVVDIIQYQAVAGSVVLAPNVLLQVSVPIAAYPPGFYWFALVADGNIVGITNKQNFQTDCPNTLKHEYDGSTDRIDYYFSTGIKTMLRVEGILYPWQSDSEVDVYEDEVGDYETTRNLPKRFRRVQYGDETQLISDYMGLKLNMITGLDNLRIENAGYNRSDESKWEPQDLGQGIPQLQVMIDLYPTENETGTTFATAGDEDIDSITFAYDATAFGQNEGVINVTDDQTS